METHKLDNWAALYSKCSLSAQRAKMIIIISFLFVAFPSSISYAKNKRKIEKVSVSSTQTFLKDFEKDSEKHIGKDTAKDSSKLLQDSVKLPGCSKKIDGDELTKVIDSNFLNSLIGRMSGATINSGAAGVGSAVRVIWRGYRSVMGSNSMLYALDGVPLQQLEAEQPSDILSNVGQTGDGIAAFPANDIESIYVLSSAAASALYGSRSAGGVMMINTKKGHPGKIRISLGNSTTFSSPLVMPEFQNTYGTRWGERLDNPQPWNPADFFRTGHTINNSLSISGGNEFNQTRFSAVTMNGAGIIPNNDVDRYNFSLRNTSSLLRDKLNIDFNLRYIHTDEQNMQAQGGYGNPLMSIYLIPDFLQKNPLYSDGVHLTDYPYRDYYEQYDPELGANVPYWPFEDKDLGMDNPYWIVNRNLINREKNRWLAGIRLKYDLTSWLDVAARFNYDRDKETGTQKFYATALEIGKMGQYYESKAKSSQLYSDLLLNVHNVFGDFSMNATLGTSFTETKQKWSDEGGYLKVANQFNLAGLGGNRYFLSEADYRDRTNSLFMIAQLGYKESLFLDLGGRMEWLKYKSLYASEYSTDEIYPSAGISVVPTGWMSNNSGNILSYLKLNYTYSEIGNSQIHRLPSNKRGLRPGVVTMEDILKPERTKSHEVGLNVSLLNGKVDLDFTMYRTTTSDLLLPVLYEGYSDRNSFYSFIPSIELENKGLELTVGTNLKLGQVKWNGRLTYSISKNRIKDIDEGVHTNMLQVNMLSSNGFRIMVKKGGSIGDLYVKDFVRDADGNVLVDRDMLKIAASGIDVYAGNVNPKYTMGLANSFSWKGIELDFVIHARIGGVGLSMTEHAMDYYGVSKAVAAARDKGWVRVSDVKIPVNNYYWVAARDFVTSEYTYDATNIRLAEMSIAYHIPVNKWVNWIQDVRVALVGRNLLMLYNKSPFDPESTVSIGTWCQGVDNFRQPSCRNIGFSVNLTF